MFTGYSCPANFSSLAIGTLLSSSGLTSNLTEAYEGDAIRTVCPANGYISNSGKSVCRAGKWSPSFIPGCSPVRCPDPRENGTGNKTQIVTGSDFNFPNIITLACKRGHRFVGVDSSTERINITCLSSQTWQPAVPYCRPVTCAALPRFPYGMWLKTSEAEYGTTITGSCLIGYSLTSGDLSRTCGENASWSGQTPICQVSYCPNLATPAYGSIVRILTTFNSIRLDPSVTRTTDTVLTLSCSVGYHAYPPAANLTCLSNGTWTPPNFGATCEGKQIVYDDHNHTSIYAYISAFSVHNPLLHITSFTGMYVFKYLSTYDSSKYHLVSTTSHICFCLCLL